jgi:hypothetical protein
LRGLKASFAVKVDTDFYFEIGIPVKAIDTLAAGYYRE